MSPSTTDDRPLFLKFKQSTLWPLDILTTDAESFVSITRTDSELSIILPTFLSGKLTKYSPEAQFNGWRCMKVETATQPDQVTGILSAVIDPLARADISVFADATFDTDHVLIQELDKSIEHLIVAGFKVYQNI